MHNHIRQAYGPCKECDKVRPDVPFCRQHLASIKRLRMRVQLTTTREICAFSWAETSGTERFHRAWQAFWSLLVFIFALVATIFVKVQKLKQYEGGFTWWDFFLCLVSYVSERLNPYREQVDAKGLGTDVSPLICCDSLCRPISQDCFPQAAS